MLQIGIIAMGFGSAAAFGAGVGSGALTAAFGPVGALAGGSSRGDK